MPIEHKSLMDRVNAVPEASSLKRFKCSLGSLSPSEFKRVQTSVKNLTKKYLDLDKTFTEQHSAIPELSKALKSAYPELYAGGGQKSQIRLNAVFNYVRRSYFPGLRKMLLQRRRAAKEPAPGENKRLDRSECLLLQAELPDSKNMSQPLSKPFQTSKPTVQARFPSQSRIVEPSTLGQAPVDATYSAITPHFKRPSFFPDMTPGTRVPVSLSSPPAYTSNNDAGPTSSTSYGPTGELSIKPGSAFAECQWQDPSAQESSSSQKSSNISATSPEVPVNDFMYRFLDSCPVQSMTRLYDALVHVDLTEWHIRVMGMTWTMEQIEVFLRKVFASNCAADGTLVPDIDVIFLAHHCVNYFRDAGKIEW